MIDIQLCGGREPHRNELVNCRRKSKGQFGRFRRESRDSANYVPIPRILSALPSVIPLTPISDFLVV